jgi:hypothetical protein
MPDLTPVEPTPNQPAAEPVVAKSAAQPVTTISAPAATSVSTTTGPPSLIAYAVIFWIGSLAFSALICGTILVCRTMTVESVAVAGTLFAIALGGLNSLGSILSQPHGR